MWSNFIRFMMFSQFSPLSVSKPDGTEQMIQKNEPSFVPLFLPEQEHALQRHSVSPAWRLDREMIGEETINSTRSMIYSLKVFYFLLYRSRYTFICFWIDLVRVLATTRNISPVAGYIAASKLSHLGEWNESRENARASGEAARGIGELARRLQAIRVYKYTKIQGPRFQRN